MFSCPLPCDTRYPDGCSQDNRLSFVADLEKLGDGRHDKSGVICRSVPMLIVTREGNEARMSLDLPDPARVGLVGHGDVDDSASLDGWTQASVAGI